MQQQSDLPVTIGCLNCGWSTQVPQGSPIADIQAGHLPRCPVQGARQKAYDAVFDLLVDDHGTVEQNARLWRAVHAALDAAGVQSPEPRTPVSEYEQESDRG